MALVKLYFPRRCELDDWTTRGLVFCYDSIYSIGAGTGAYRPQDNLTLINTIKSTQSIFNVDAFPVFGLKVKSHLNQPQNEYVDGLADLGAEGVPCPHARSVTTADYLAAVSRIRRAENLNFQPLPPDDSLLIIDPTLSHTDTVSQFYQQLVTAGKSVLDVVQSFLPRTKPARQYINSRCLQLLDQRKSAFQLNLMYSYELLNKEIRREAKRAKNDFIRTEIEIRKWVGIKYCRAFVPKPIKIQDTAGHFHRIQLRAQILGKYYETTQWHHQPLPPLPDRPPLFPIPDDLPTGVFTCDELRNAAPYLKKNKTPGTDEISNEMLLIFLNDPIGFALVLRLMNYCWTHVVLPTDWQVARICAIFKNKGSTSLPTNYRPIALLQTFYKLFTVLIGKRLRLLEHRILKMQKGFLKGRSTDDANFLMLRLQDLSRKWQSFPLYFLFLVWVKCYDRIHHAPLLDALRRFGLPDHYLKILEAVYSD